MLLWIPISDREGTAKREWTQPGQPGITGQLGFISIVRIVFA
jgi:hypothetical protein